MTKLNPEWAIGEIDAFLRVTAQVGLDTGPGVVYFGTVMRGSKTEASERAHVIEKILDRVFPGWSAQKPEKDPKFTWLRDQAARAKAAIERASELAKKLGDNAPDMDAANLHPWAWENGRSYWNTRHFHQAVMQAAIHINAETQAKLGRKDLSETALFNEAFSPQDPKKGCPGYASRKSMAVRLTRIFTAVQVPLLRDSIPGYETLECTGPTRAMVARSNWRWSNWPRSVCWPAR